MEPPFGSGAELSAVNRSGISPHIEPDIFPPIRSQAPEYSPFLPYIPEDIAFEEEYQDYLSDLGDDDLSHMEQMEDESFDGHLQNTRALSAWRKLADFSGDLADGISDSESIVSIGELEVDGSMGVDENKNNWEVCNSEISILHDRFDIPHRYQAFEPQDSCCDAEVTSRWCTTYKLWGVRASPSYTVWVG